MHQAGLRQLGARCNIEHGCVVAEADHLRGAEIQLEFPSVGATENILMAAVLAEGVTTIYNAAREPDIVDLCTMLNQMGAQVAGAGIVDVDHHGVDRLYPTEHRVIGDRIVAATWGDRGGDDAGRHLGHRSGPAASAAGAAQAARRRRHGRRRADDGFRVVQYDGPRR